MIASRRINFIFVHYIRTAIISKIDTSEWKFFPVLALNSNFQNFVRAGVVFYSTPFPSHIILFDKTSRDLLVKMQISSSYSIVIVVVSRNDSVGFN